MTPSSETDHRTRAVAPTLPPGVVLYAPNSLKSEVLLSFARELAGRRWRVAGVVIVTLCDAAGNKIGLDLVDLATGIARPLARPETDGIAIGRWVLDPATVAAGDAAIQRAVADRSELIIVDKYGPLETSGEAFAAGLRAALDSGLPLLVAARAEFLDVWDDFARRPTVPLRPSRAELWRWWGPHRLHQELIRAVPDLPCRRVVIGSNWTLVEGPHACGLAMSPARDAPGCRSLDEAGDFSGRSLRALAELSLAWNPAEAAIGVAAINAHFNRPELAGQALDGLDGFAGWAGRKFVIGRFPELSRKVPDAQVIERVPANGELPAAAADWILPAADALAVTASALGNLTLTHILARAAHARIALIGPGTPLAPALHEYGIELLSGFVIEDADAAARAVAEGGAVKALKRHGRKVTLAAPAVPAADDPASPIAAVRAVLGESAA